MNVKRDRRYISTQGCLPLHFSRKAPGAITGRGFFDGLIEDILLYVHHVQLEDRNNDEVADATDSADLNIKMQDTVGTKLENR